MLKWKTWCRLCGNYEVSAKIEPEVEKIAKQLFLLQSQNAYICLDCKAYVQDINEFLIKSKNVAEMFDELERCEEVDDETLLLIRLNHNLSVPEIEYIEEPEAELVADLNEIECFQLESDDRMSESVQEGEVEYLLENYDTEQEMEEDLTEEETELEQHEVEYDVEIKETSHDAGEIVRFEEDEMIFQEVAASESEFTAKKNSSYDAYSDDIENHFEFICHLCNEQFKKMYFLTTHTHTVHDCPPRVLCKCGRTIATTKSLVDHYSNHIVNAANFRCNDCNKSYKTQTHFNNHMVAHHSHDDESDSRKFTCDCGRSFKELRHLTTHRNSHLPNELKFIHLCTYCDRRYSSIFSLRQHIKHIHVKEANLHCQFCDKTFSRKANLDSHVSHVHTTERKFECEICGLKVKTKSILRVHKKIHSTNPDDFSTCEVCQKVFKTQNQLTNHMICHTDVKKHKCNLCTAEYKRSKELTAHIASVHTNESRYTCTFCSKSFYNNSNYRKHKLKMHAKEIEINSG